MGSKGVRKVRYLLAPLAITSTFEKTASGDLWKA